MHQYSLIGLLLSSETYPMPKFLFFGSKILQMVGESQQLCSLIFLGGVSTNLCVGQGFYFWERNIANGWRKSTIVLLIFWRRGKLNDLLHNFLGTIKES